MPRESSGRTTSKVRTPSRDVSTAAQDLIYRPSNPQRLVKARFWTQYRDDMTVEPDKITAAQVMQIVDEPKVASWWKEPGFRSWFVNDNEHVERAEYVYGLWMDRIEARLEAEGCYDLKELTQIGKLLAEIAGKTPDRSKKTKFLDAGIDGMSRDQLIKLIKSAVPQLGDGDDQK